MAWLIALLLLVIGPIVELWFILQVADVIGGWQTIGLLLVEGILGSWLIKRQGRSVIRRIDERLRASDLPTTELADGLLILIAGVLMLTPGFLTDIVGFALLFPPTRAIARVALLRRFTARMGQGFAFVSGPMFGGGARRPRADVFDATVRDTPPARRDTTPLGPGDRR
ncbi:FxsA family protein [Iamia sp. SCSIO 61187]|uniref:FxsA family protein n=1 Tax=Iamia sp. SCSIO 61187 TaxID=2722752 RepID=UPI001C63ABD0|nr:FxsA family protein [Iamia sp. SCSIO 61187]QYG94741.1 FxsA family protein [Iamia sp. SCSIO 61187]